MKKRIILPLLFTSLLLSGCSWFNKNNSSSSTSGTNATTSGPTSSSTSHKPGTGKLDLYCVNDFHGAVSQYNGNKYVEGGIARLAQYYQNEKNSNEGESIFLSAGDMWQETYDSGMNKGKLVTEAFAEMGCEASALGNHEFDWGVGKIKENKAIAESKGMKFLACNVYNYVGEAATTHASDLSDQYKIVDKGDIRIGIIGSIGTSQITSITSSNWDNLTFVAPRDIIKNISNDLRSQHGCDVIVLLHHGGLNDEGSMYRNLSENSPLTGRPYIDAGFMGHTHQFETDEVNGVPWLQAYQHGSVIGHIGLTVESNKVTCNYQYCDGEGIASDSIYASTENPEVKQIVDNYLTPEFNAKKSAVVGTLTNYNKSYIQDDAGNMLAKVTSLKIDELRNKGEDIPQVDVILNNGARSQQALDNTHSLTYEKVFNLVPFTNKTIIAEVKGSDIIAEAINYSNPYYLPGESNLVINSNQTYVVAVIDYLMLHKDKNRNYNYFKTYTSSIYEIEEYGYELIWEYFEKNNTLDMSFLNTSACNGLSR